VADELVKALSTIAVLHPDEVDVLLRDTQRLDLRGDVIARSDIGTSRQLFDRVAFFSNAVNQTLRYPAMRTALVQGTMEELANAATPGNFITGFARKTLRLLRDHDYHLGTWAGVEPGGDS